MTASDPTDPADMTPDQRLAEVAAILAEGVLRLHQRAAIPTTLTPSANLQIPLESSGNGLDDCAETRLHGHPVNASEKTKTRGDA